MSKIQASRRKKAIVQLALEKKHIEVRELADQFGVTTETIRKDLLELDRQNILKKGHGEATLSSTYQENVFSMKVHANEELKARIAAHAVTMIPDNGVAMIDSGSTTVQVAKLLNAHTGLVVITNSLSVAQVLANTSNQLLVVGGELRTKSQSFVGSWASKILATVVADISFIGCDGFNDSGPCIRSYREVEIKQLMLSQAKKTVLLCDSTKIRASGLYTFAPYDAFDCLVTDSGIDNESREHLTGKVELIVV